MALLELGGRDTGHDFSNTDPSSRKLLREDKMIIMMMMMVVMMMMMMMICFLRSSRYLSDIIGGSASPPRDIRMYKHWGFCPVVLHEVVASQPTPRATTCTQ